MKTVKPLFTTGCFVLLTSCNQSHGEIAENSGWTQISKARSGEDTIQSRDFSVHKIRE